jgi:hypothetical protein
MSRYSRVHTITFEKHKFNYYKSQAKKIKIKDIQNSNCAPLQTTIKIQTSMNDIIVKIKKKLFIEGLFMSYTVTRVFPQI